MDSQLTSVFSFDNKSLTISILLFSTARCNGCLHNYNSELYSTHIYKLCL